MGLSVLSAMMIQNNEVECEAQGPFDNGMYGYIIWMIKEGRRHIKIVSVDYGYYDTSDEAITGAENLVDEICRTDLATA